jgi:hypothetical protein
MDQMLHGARDGPLVFTETAQTQRADVLSNTKLSEKGVTFTFHVFFSDSPSDSVDPTDAREYQF